MNRCVSKDCHFFPRFVQSTNLTLFSPLCVIPKKRMLNYMIDENNIDIEKEDTRYIEVISYPHPCFYVLPPMRASYLPGLDHGIRSNQAAQKWRAKEVHGHCLFIRDCCQRVRNMFIYTIMRAHARYSWVQTWGMQVHDIMHISG